MLLLPGSQLPASPGDNSSEELQGWGQARPLLASITAAPLAQPYPVSFLSSFPCFPSLLFLQKSFSLPRPSSLHRLRIRPRRVCSISTPTALRRRKLGSDWGQRSRPLPQDSKAAPRTYTNHCTCTPISHRARTPKVGTPEQRLPWQQVPRPDTAAGRQDMAREATFEPPMGHVLGPGAASRGNPAAGYGPMVCPSPAPPARTTLVQPLSLPPLPKGPLCLPGGSGGGAGAQERDQGSPCSQHGLSACSQGNQVPMPEARAAVTLTTVTH